MAGHTFSFIASNQLSKQNWEVSAISDLSLRLEYRLRHERDFPEVCVVRVVRSSIYIHDQRFCCFCSTRMGAMTDWRFSSASTRRASDCNARRRQVSHVEPRARTSAH